MVAALLVTENPSVIRNCRFESGWHGLTDRVRFPVSLFDGKNIVEYLYQTKDTESHEDSDFCYDWGRKNV